MFEEWLSHAYANYAPLSVIASGGNINKAHKLLSKEEKAPLSYDEIESLYEILRKMSYDERMLKYNMNAYRADVIIPALKIFLIVGKICKIDEFNVPKVGLVDGIIHHLYANSL
jgi:exopolyphosphatase/guanosine-5'-triphosphate,3'-diphosphate pyrophosphatase